MSRTKRAKPHYDIRFPRTHAERRLVASAIEEGVHVRARRTGKHLPSSYDDKVVAAIYETHKSHV